MTKDWITLQQAAEELQVHTDTIKNWVKKGLLTSSQMVPRGAIRISTVSIEKMLERSKQKVQS